MLITGVRFCDVSNEAIEAGARYATSIVPKDQSPPLMSLISENEDSPGFSIDMEGNVRIDVCLECKLNMGLTARLTSERPGGPFARWVGRLRKYG